MEHFAEPKPARLLLSFLIDFIFFNPSEAKSRASSQDVSRKYSCMLEILIFGCRSFGFPLIRIRGVVNLSGLLT